jgi:ABC-type sugar transport system ATPase subunit
VSESASTDGVVRAEGIRKSFGAVVALDDVNVRLGRGEVLGLIGDNGAGKSTLIKVLTGFHRPDAGRIVLDGSEVSLRSVSRARQLGIETVFQDLALIDQLPVYINMNLNNQHEPQQGAAAMAAAASRQEAHAIRGS